VTGRHGHTRLRRKYKSAASAALFIWDQRVDILDAFIAHEPPPILYHYTNGVGVLGIIQKRVLYASSSLHLNDAMEHKIANHLLNEELEASRLSEVEKHEFRSLMRFAAQRSSYVCSFSENGNVLSQWRAYCREGHGFAVGFSRNNPLFGSAKQNSFSLVPCVYKKREQKKLCRALINTFREQYLNAGHTMESRANLPDTIRAFFANYNWTYAFLLVNAALKHIGFKEEAEWRLISQRPEDLNLTFRTGRFGLVPYFRLPLPFLAERVAQIDDIYIDTADDQSPTIQATKALLAKEEASGKLALSDDLKTRGPKISGIPFRQ
jgi:hypothetical protein